MNKEQHMTVSLEIAKELKKLGWQPATIFMYTPNILDLGRSEDDYATFEYTLVKTDQIILNKEFSIAAPQMHEMMPLFPFKTRFKFGVSQWKGRYNCASVVKSDYAPYSVSENPHDAIAQLLLRLIEEGYILPPNPTPHE